MKNRRDWLQAAAGVAAVVVLVLGSASPAWAPNGCGGGCRTTSLFLPLSGEFFVVPAPMLPVGETVMLTGKVHVVATVVPGPPTSAPGNFLADIHLNIGGVTGVGQTTGRTYIGEGSAKLLDVSLASGGVSGGGCFQAIFSLEPATRGGSVPLPLQFHLFVGDDGTLLRHRSLW